MKTFTIDEIRKYLESKYSLDDIHSYLSEENIIKANLKNEIEDGLLRDKFGEIIREYDLIFINNSADFVRIFSDDNNELCFLSPYHEKKTYLKYIKSRDLEIYRK